MSDVYRQALAKCQWAEKHIDNLKSAIAEFWKHDPCSVSKKTDAKTGDVTYYVAHVPAVPDEIPLIIGDVLHNLRCALDYMACGMVGAGCVTSKTKFPIRRDPKDWEVSGLRMVDGASQEAIETLRRIRPYEGGNTLLYVLHALNNIDKHRLLLAATIRTMGRTALEAEQIVGNALDEKGSIYAGGESIRFPLYAGQELLTVPAAQAEQNMRFLFHVTLAEPGPTKGMPILVTLDMASKAVGKTLRELQPFV